jgi:hypothetical protein
MDPNISTETGESVQGRSPRFTLWVAFLVFSTITLGSSVQVVRSFLMRRKRVIDRSSKRHGPGFSKKATVVTTNRRRSPTHTVLCPALSTERQGRNEKLFFQICRGMFRCHLCCDCLRGTLALVAYRRPHLCWNQIRRSHLLHNGHSVGGCRRYRHQRKRWLGRPGRCHQSSPKW